MQRTEISLWGQFFKEIKIASGFENQTWLLTPTRTSD